MATQTLERAAGATLQPQPHDRVVTPEGSGEVFWITGGTVRVWMERGLYGRGFYFFPKEKVVVTHRTVKRDGDVWRCKSRRHEKGTYILREREGQRPSCTCQGFLEYGDCYHSSYVQDVIDCEKESMDNDPTPDPSPDAPRTWVNEVEPWDGDDNDPGYLRFQADIFSDDDPIAVFNRKQSRRGERVKAAA